ncbi:Peptidase family S41 [Pricia antarctica]|uniref:Peptidase family S41 n=1 Tax=Pricia antarctica TaxID=641691 RepID=A0A1G6Z1K9_9FLAO|nr:S41 family peptidase [Pricia antarctica]SDD96488.1 Peptidase family S41 [Pricia antarctica]
MKNAFLLFILVVSSSIVNAQDEEKIAHLKAFAKTYGYVKYFHPSDEAANLDWNAFAIYGAAQIEKCNSEKEVLLTLKELFGPIAPSADFQMGTTPSKYDSSKITPKDAKDYKLTYWQHKGVSRGMAVQGRPYLSVRINRTSTTDNSSPFGNVMTSIDAAEYKGKDIKYSGSVKLCDGSEGTGHLWFRVDNSDGSKGFFDNLGNSPITKNEWMDYEIQGNVDSLATSLVFGCFLKGKGKLLLDDVHLSYKDGGEWIDIPIENSDFESEALDDKHGQWRTRGYGYSFGSVLEDTHEGEKSAVIDYVGATMEEKGNPIFDFEPKFGELIEKNLGGTIFCQIPLVLYADDEHTYPQSKKADLTFLEKQLESAPSDPAQLAFRLGNVINTFNVFQHFYPYFDVVDVDWDAAFEKALSRCFTDKTAKDHLITLQKFTAELKDGHVSVSGMDSETFAPPITWEWIEDKLIITHIFDEKKGLKVGDEVTRIDNQSAADYFKEIESRISAGTQGWLAYRAKDASLFGAKDSKLVITSKGKNRELIRDKDFYREVRSLIPKRDSYKAINDYVFYLNLDAVSMDAINELMPELVNYKSIICDMRGYPNSNHEFISHLLKSNDTTEAWMQVPKIVYPDREKIVGFEGFEWKMRAKKPYLGDKQIIFITDGRAISYAESFMGYIEGYDLATIIGQPTAGTNGNVNSFELSGGYAIRWTGMKVVKHDGSQQHAVGILPDIYIEKTIDGVISGKDEFLEKAIELTEKN